MKGKSTWEKQEREFEEYKSQIAEWKAAIEEDRKRLEEEAKRVDSAKALLDMQSGARTTTVVKGTIGSVSEFCLDDNWQLWYERLQMYFVANEVGKSRIPAVFLTLLGKDGYALLQNLLAPIKPHEVTLEHMVQVLKNHLQPAPSIIAERYKFKECRQIEDQDVKAFLANLKRSSTYCEFGDNLDSALRD